MSNQSKVTNCKTNEKSSNLDHLEPEKDADVPGRNVVHTVDDVTSGPVGISGSGRLAPIAHLQAGLAILVIMLKI